MMLNIDKIREIRDDDKKKLKDIRSVAETIKSQAIDEYEKQHQSILKKIEELQNKKESLLRSPISNKELLSFAKECLKKERENLLLLLRKHLEDCQKGHSTPFHELAMKYLFAEHNAYRYAYLIVTENDIDDLVGQISEIGIPSSERDKLIAEIDSEIENQFLLLKKHKK